MYMTIWFVILLFTFICSCMDLRCVCVCVCVCWNAWNAHGWSKRRFTQIYWSEAIPSTTQHATRGTLQQGRNTSVDIHINHIYGLFASGYSASARQPSRSIAVFKAIKAANSATVLELMYFSSHDAVALALVGSWLFIGLPLDVPER